MGDYVDPKTLDPDEWPIVGDLATDQWRVVHDCTCLPSVVAGDGCAGEFTAEDPWAVCHYCARLSDGYPCPAEAA